MSYFTDSLSTIKAMLSRKNANQTHPLVYACKQLCWSLCQNRIEVMLMWIPPHVGLVGNVLVDERARLVALDGSIFKTGVDKSMAGKMRLCEYCE
jgi:ribonuclease HI